MIDQLTTDYHVAMDWAWEDWEPYYTALAQVELTPENIETWLLDWSTVGRMTAEVASRLNVATTVDTTDAIAEGRYKNFMATIFPQVQQVTFALNQKLVASGLAPDEISIPMRNIRAQIALFRESNLPLHTKISDLSTQYNKLSGSQMVEWEGKEITLRQLAPVFKEQDRERREKAWKVSQERLRQDREKFNDLWREFMETRKQIYQNADLENYRAYAWLDRGRFDYSPEDALEFCEAIEQVVVPVAERLRDAKRRKMGYDTLRPWDTEVDPSGLDPVKPYETIQEFIDKTEAIFYQVDPELGDYFHTMKTEQLLDLENRKGKGPGGYCTYFPVSERPFIFMNAVGLDGDVRTLLHEAGHAFHGFSANNMKYSMQRRAPMEFNEVASMAMELLATPYITTDNGGYFNEADAKRFRADHLRGIINFWPYMAVVVAFQHWIYTNHDLATDASVCDEKWLELWNRYMKGIDFTGYEDFIANRWRQQLHIFRLPFYYIEYGLAQLGSVQVWANALDDQAQALAKYREALKLGGTVTLPELYDSAGAKLAFDAKTLQQAVDLVERVINELEA